MTTYNGTTISYDGAGNPTSYYNGLKFNWTQGRQLSRVYTTRNTVATYQYDTAGIRIAKNVGGVSTRYFMDASGAMQALERGIEKLVFFYDVTGRREGFSYYINDELEGHYYYVYNVQGDVRGILDSNFEAVVLYDYDSWGRPLGITGELAQSIRTLNPFRYRGYIYDEETGFYYLNSRYYDPVVGRLINADAYISTGQGVLGYNMFAYCLNNPVNSLDLEGTKAHDLNELTRVSIFSGAGSAFEIIDLTEKLDEFMQQNAEKFKSYVDTHEFVDAILYFRKNVNDGGVLDIKRQEEWTFEEGKRYFYKGEELRQDDLGNINYGYVGTVLLKEEVLCFFAGLNQIKKYKFAFGDISTYFDDPRDQEMIRWGIAIYWEVN